VLSPVSSVLTDPGPLCTNDTVVLNCSAAGSIAQSWRYDGEMITFIQTRIGQLPPADPMERSGVAFSVSLLSTSPVLLSQIVFVASQMMNGSTLICASAPPGESMLIVENVVLELESEGGCIL